MELNKNKKVEARQLYLELKSKQSFAVWIARKIAQADLKEGKDFKSFKIQSTGGRPAIEYELEIKAAKEICLLQQTPEGHKVRQKLIEIEESHEEGLAFTTPQIEALMDLAKAMTLISIQSLVEKKHFDLYNDKYSWYQYRAALLGYNTDTLISAMKAVNKKHKTIKKSLMQLDKDELIRTGVIDFMLVLGKTKEYATNVGNLCKSISQKSEYGNIIWDDTQENPLGLNTPSVSERKQLFNKVGGERLIK